MSEDNLADIGTKALSKIIIRKAISMEYVDVQENLKIRKLLWGNGSRNESGQIRAVQRSRKRHRQSAGGHARQRQHERHRGQFKR